MSLYYPTAQPTIAANIMVRKRRMLPVAGEILVRLGARVAPDDVVAHANLPGVPIVLDVAAGLRVAPKQAARYLARPIGSLLEAGEAVASRRIGLTSRRVIKAPVAGTLADYDAGTGQATLTPPGAPLELHAYIDGVITEHIPSRGVVIDTPAVLVRGILGVGGEQHGVLQVAVAGPEEELTPDQISARLAYAIVLGGGTTTAAALRRAVEHNVRAVIVGSIPEEELRAFLGYTNGLHGWELGRTGWGFPPAAGPTGPRLPLTLIVVEGFGHAPMVSKAWELLAAHDGGEVAVDGTTRLRGAVARPEIIVPLAHATGIAPYETTAPPLAVRRLVRLIAPPYLGQTARVVAVAQGKQPIASGLSANAAEVEFPSGARTWIPLANLEVIE